MRLSCVCPERCVQVFFLVWAGVAVGWLVDFQFTFQRLAIVCLEREESMRSWMQVLDAGSALYV